MPGCNRYGMKVETLMYDAKPGTNPYGSAIDHEVIKKYGKPCYMAPVEKSIPCLPVPELPDAMPRNSGEVSIVVELREGDPSVFNRWFDTIDHGKPDVQAAWKEFEKHLRKPA